jgi:pimeloyl-ACP methyl ester carboxylesterase
MWLLAGGMGGASAQPVTPAPEVPAGMREHRINEPVFQGQASVYETGTQHARSILLIHGIGDDGARDFRELIPWLAQEFHVVSFDLPGFGRSSKANVLYSPANYATFVKVVADKYIRRPFMLLGHSMGGVVALRYAATYPRDIERLVVVDTPGILHRLAFTGKYLVHLGVNFMPPGVNARDKLGSLVHTLLGQAERTHLDPEVILASSQLRQTMLDASPTKIAGLAVAVDNVSQLLRGIETETLVVWGKDDTLAPLRTGTLLTDTIPHARLSVLDKTGHVPMLESPAAFRAVVEPFLHQGRGRGAPAVEAKPVAAARHGHARCERGRNLVFEGDYDSLVIKDCEGVRIRHARIGTLRIFDSHVTIEQSRIGGGDIGLHAHNARVTMTGGRIEGGVAVYALDSQLDLAGIEVVARRAAVQAGAASSVVFSISRLDSPHTRGDVHGYYHVAPGKPL